MDNDNTPLPPPYGFTRYLEKQDFNKAMGEVDTRFNKMEVTFHGPDGKTGIVKDINTLRQEWMTSKEIMGWIMGSSLISLLTGVLTLLKLFNVI